MSKADEIIKLKSLLDKGTITKEDFDNQKKTLLNKDKEETQIRAAADKIFKVIGIIAICFVALTVLIIAFGGEEENKNDTETIVETEKSFENPLFKDEFPVEVSARIEDNILGMPEIKCRVNNVTDKNICALQLYFEPYDVYGDEVNSILVTKKLDYTDTIPANTSKQIEFGVLGSDVKSGTLYIYSVYFDDKSEWGNRSATESDILKYAYKIDLN